MAVFMLAALLAAGPPRARLTRLAALLMGLLRRCSCSAWYNQHYFGSPG